MSPTLAHSFETYLTAVKQGLGILKALEVVTCSDGIYRLLKLFLLAIILHSHILNLELKLNYYVKYH